jgi:hypothetical protein
MNSICWSCYKQENPCESCTVEGQLNSPVNSDDDENSTSSHKLKSTCPNSPKVDDVSRAKLIEIQLLYQNAVEESRKSLESAESLKSRLFKTSNRSTSPISSQQSLIVPDEPVSVSAEDTDEDDFLSSHDNKKSQKGHKNVQKSSNSKPD